MALVNLKITKVSFRGFNKSIRGNLFLDSLIKKTTQDHRHLLELLQIIDNLVRVHPE